MTIIFTYFQVQAQNPKIRSTSMIAPRNAIPEVMNTSSANVPTTTAAAGPKRHNLKGRHSNSVDNLTPVKPRANLHGSKHGQHQQQGSSRRARDLEQHLRDKYGLPSENKNLLRRASSHSSLTPQYPSQGKLLLRIKYTLFCFSI